jgi:L-lactate dehydrogenase complex protein LldG
MTGREKVLSRVNSALAPLGRRAQLPDFDAGSAAPDGLAGEGGTEAVFMDRIRSVNGEAVSGPAAAAARLRAGGWMRGYCDPALWPGLAPHFGPDFDVALEFDRSRVDDYAFGITRAAGAIAETGTIILEDATTSRRLAALAPWVHVAAIPRSRIHATLAEALAALGGDPNVIWVTGPSKTADVEGILIEGVHGPGVQIALLL